MKETVEDPGEEISIIERRKTDVEFLRSWTREGGKEGMG